MNVMTSDFAVTVFTPTYNRGNLLPRLYESLIQQTSHDFEWLVVDDGSTDNTEALFTDWLQDLNRKISIRYIRKANGGKARAINLGLKEAKGKYFFIVDSDDYLAIDAVETIIKWFDELPEERNFIGVSGVKQDVLDLDKHKDLIDKEGIYFDISNIERPEYSLQADMAEAFYTGKLRKYEFPVWPTEKFLPESVVWDQIAMDGYILRWHTKVIYYCEYLDGGLTKSSWKLLRDNPMGYALMYQQQIKYTKSFKKRINQIVQFISCCCLAQQYLYILKVKDINTLLLFPIGLLLSFRRRIQFKQYLE